MIFVTRHDTCLNAVTHLTMLALDLPHLIGSRCGARGILVNLCHAGIAIHRSGTARPPDLDFRDPTILVLASRADVQHRVTYPGPCGMARDMDRLSTFKYNNQLLSLGIAHQPRHGPTRPTQDFPAYPVKQNFWTGPGRFFVPGWAGPRPLRGGPGRRNWTFVPLWSNKTRVLTRVLGNILMGNP